MSGEQIRLLVPPKLFGVNSWNPHITRQCTSPNIRLGYLS